MGLGSSPACLPVAHPPPCLSAQQLAHPPSLPALPACPPARVNCRCPPGVLRGQRHTHSSPDCFPDRVKHRPSAAEDPAAAAGAGVQLRVGQLMRHGQYAYR